MKDIDKTKEQLISELTEMRQRIAVLEASESGWRRVEEALRESEEKYHGIVTTLIDGVVSIDAQMGVILWNQGMERIFGYTEKEMLGQTIMKIVPERHREAMKKGLALFVKTGSEPAESAGRS